MATWATESKHYLTGDWTLTGVTKQLPRLTSYLEKLNSAHHKSVHIDCSKIEAIDMSGLQLLHVWVELIKVHGVEPTIVNPPDYVQKNIHRLGVKQCDTDRT